MNEFIEVLQVRGARIVLKINGKKINSLRLRINEAEEVIFGNETINQLDSFIDLGCV